MDMLVIGRPVDPDNRRRDLAWRLFAHQVRMGTVRELTTFSRHQQKTLRNRWGFPADTRPRVCSRPDRRHLDRSRDGRRRRSVDRDPHRPAARDR